MSDVTSLDVMSAMWRYESAAYDYIEACNSARKMPKSVEKEYRRAANALFQQLVGRKMTDEEFAKLCGG